MPRGYWIARVDVHDPEGYKDYVAAAKLAFDKFNIKFLARGGQHEFAEGQVARAGDVPAPEARPRLVDFLVEPRRRPHIDDLHRTRRAGHQRPCSSQRWQRRAASTATSQPIHRTIRAAHAA